jgi:hypothetical protein
LLVLVQKASYEDAPVCCAVCRALYGAGLQRSKPCVASPDGPETPAY